MRKVVMLIGSAESQMCINRGWAV